MNVDCFIWLIYPVRLDDVGDEPRELATMYLLQVILFMKWVWLLDLAVVISGRRFGEVSGR